MCKRSACIIMAGLALGSLLLVGSPAGAQSVYAPYVYAPDIDQREAYQQQRIQQGIDSGALTPGETRYLNREQGRIDRAEDRMQTDGRLSLRERQRRNQMQDQANRDIYRLKHNNRTTDGWGGPNHHGWGGHHNYGWNGYAYAPRIERREAYQEQRIQQGIDSGALTPGEARYLNREQGRIDRMEDRMQADGRLSPWERQRLNQMQNRAGRDIYRLEHNNRSAAGYPGYHGNHAGWQGNNRGWDGRNYARHGDNPHGPSNHPGGNPNNRGWHGSGNSGWHGNNPGGNGHAPGGPAPGVPGTNGTTTVRNFQGPQGHYARQGQPGAYQQPGARPAQAPAFQGRQGHPQQYQQARQPMPQTNMRPNTNMMARQPSMARQPGGFGGMVNRANFSGGGAGLRRR